MIVRIWHGWTSRANADAYEHLLQEEIFVGIHERHIKGFRGIQLLRRSLTDPVEFVTIMTFDSLAATSDQRTTRWSTKGARAGRPWSAPSTESRTPRQPQSVPGTPSQARARRASWRARPCGHGPRPLREWDSK